MFNFLSVKDIIAILLIPFEMIIGSFLINKVESELSKVIIFFLLSAIVLFILLIFYKDTLASDWKKYRKKIWLKILIAILLFALIPFILKIVRAVIPQQLLDTKITQENNNMLPSILVTFISAISALFAPFIEEIIFRYIFIGKPKEKTTKIIMLFLQALFFGLIHINNFNGNIFATIPYMFVGLYFGIIYLVSNNIWTSIFTHFIFNFVSTTAPSILLIFYMLFNK